MSYTAQDHAEDRAGFLEDSIPVLFTREVPAVDAIGRATGAMVAHTVLVHCMDNYVGGTPEEILKISLGEIAGPMLFGIPDVFGQEPDAGMECDWKGTPHTVKAVAAYAPQGTTAMMTIALKR